MKISPIYFKYFLLVFLITAAYTVYAQQPKLMLPIGHTSEILTMSMSPDGKYLFTGSRDMNGVIWDTRTGKEVFRQTAHTHMIYASDIDHTNSLVVTGGWDGTLQVWDFKKAAHIKTLRQGDIHSCKFNPVDNATIAFSNQENICIWNFQTGRVDTLEDYTGDSFESVSFSSDGKYLAAGDWRGKVNIWNTITKELHHTFDLYPSRICDVAFKPGTYLLASVNSGRPNMITLFDVEKKTVLKKNSYPVKDSLVYHDANLLFDSRGQNLAVVANDEDGGSFCIFDGNSLDTLLFNHNSLASINSLAFDPINFNLFVGTIRGFIGIWDISTGKRLRKFEGFANRINDLSFSPDNKQLAIADNHSIKILDLQKAILSNTISNNGNEVYSLSYHPDGKSLAGSEYDSLFLWNLDTKHYNQYYTQESIEEITKVKFDNTGTRLLYLGHNGYVGVLDVKTMESMNNSSAAVFDNAAISGDGKWFGYIGVEGMYGNSTGLGRVVYDSTERNIWENMKTSRNLMKSIAFDKRSTKVIFATDDEIGIWSLSNGEKLDSLIVEQGGISRVVFNSAGNKIFITTFSGKFIVWYLSDHSTKTIQFPDPLNDILISDDDRFLIVKTKFRLFFLSTENYSTRYTLSLINDDLIYQTPEGYYMSTPAAAKQLHYVTKDLKIITFEQLDVRYNRPDKVLEAIGNTDTALIKSYRKAWEKRIKKLGIDTTAFRAGYSVPEADFANRDNIEYEHKNGKLKLNIKSSDSTYKLDRFNVWVNESPVYGMRGINIRSRNKKDFDTTVTINLCEGNNRIETTVLNTNGIESYRMPLHVNYTPPVSTKEKTYFIGIGIDKFEEKKYNLAWSVKDITDLAAKLNEKNKEFVLVDTLFNERVTTENIKALKKKLLATTENDKVVIAYSGHGLLSNDYDYYLSTYNINFKQPEQNGLAYEDLESLLDGIPAIKKLMLIDACHSGEVDKEELMKMKKTQSELDGTKGIIEFEEDSTNRKLGMKNSFDLMNELFANVNKSTGATIISAAAGTQFALERGDLKNGVFTYCILEAMEQNKTMNVSGLKQKVSARVEELTKGMQKPTSRNEALDYDWKVW